MWSSQHTAYCETYETPSTTGAGQYRMAPPINDILCICALQEGQHVIGDAYDNVVIMFSDIVGFSTMSSSMSAVEVFLMLTNLYYAFDRLVDKYGVYKVETIGDGYMIAAGQPLLAAVLLTPVVLTPLLLTPLLLTPLLLTPSLLTPLLLTPVLTTCVTAGAMPHKTHAV